MSRDASPFRCQLVLLDEVYELAFELARQVRDARFQPDAIVAIARGGFVPARLLCDFLGVERLGSVRIRHYSPGAHKEAQARSEEALPRDLARELAGRRILVVDDVNDTGETLAVARAQLASTEAHDVRIAVLHEKSSSSESADFRARSLETWRWLLYQWAVVEDCLGFVARMHPLPARPDDARERLASDFGLRLPDALWAKVRARLPGCGGGGG